MEKTAEQLRREHIALEGDTHGKNKWAILFTVLSSPLWRVWMRAS